MNKIIVSMTSYPARIKNVGKSIYLLLKKQKLKPDEIHVWLSKTEFKKLEKDLPEDVLLMINNNNNVFLHWVDKNTYCHKRHEIFKYVNNDYVFFVDEDVVYDDNLISGVMDISNRFPDCIINYERYSKHLYRGKKILYKNVTDYSKPRHDIRWCGQSMIPSRLYPIEVLNEQNSKVRDEVCPICDESWLTPWIVYHNIPIYCCHYGWGHDIDETIDHKKGLCEYTHKKDKNGLEKRDNWLYEVLNKYDFLMKDYKKKFNYER